MAKQALESVRSKVPVYEIELDLTDWKVKLSTEVPNFAAAILELLPSLKEHICMSGEPGGFCQELRKGTNFAHVIEHIILELIHLANSEKQYFTGWTRQLDKREVYIVHYDAPDFLTGRLAAILSIDLVKRLIKGETPSIDNYVELLKDPHSYFTDGDTERPAADEPLSVIQGLDESAAEFARRPSKKLSLSGEQMEISGILGVKGMVTDGAGAMLSGVWREV
ncbi:MAG: hypothetical protein L7F78_23650 [Syntrophales bacterium LBB04]|nr:hypothetical protein [Syntrophales bacterium LBB04]